MKPQGWRVSFGDCWSPPTRGAWIETEVHSRRIRDNPVAPHAGGVD